MKEELISLYIRKFKTYLIPIVILFISLVAFMQIFLPNIQKIPEMNSQIDQKKQENIDLEETYNALIGYDDADLEVKIADAELALPETKTVLDLYLNIISAAAKAQINITKFVLKPGVVYTKQKETQTAVGQTFPSFEGQVDYDSPSIESFKQFALLLQQAVPLMEIKDMDTQSGTGRNVLVFFYKPYSIAELAKPVKIRPLTEKQQQILKDIENRKDALNL